MVDTSSLSSSSLFINFLILQLFKAFSIFPSFLYSLYLSAKSLYGKFLRPYVLLLPIISILLNVLSGCPNGSSDLPNSLKNSSSLKAFAYFSKLLSFNSYASLILFLLFALLGLSFTNFMPNR